MPNWITPMAEAIYPARDMGVPLDLVAPDNAQDLAQPLMMVGGVLPWPALPKISLIQPGDSAFIKDAKSFSVGAFSVLAMNLLKASDEVTKAQNDGRLSESGRLERKLAAYAAWNATTSRTLAQYETRHAALVRTLEGLNLPEALEPGNAAQAIGEVELRTLVRNMDSQAKRVAYAHRLEVDSPILLAILRGDPAASGLTREQHTVLAGRYGLRQNADEIAQVWAAAMALDAVSYVLYWGTKRLANACGQPYDAKFQEVAAAVEQSPARAKLIAMIDSTIEAAAGMKFVEPEPEPVEEAPAE